MSSDDTQARAWQHEYELKRSIESSTTTKPEKCIAWFLSWLQKEKIGPGRLLDIGAGLGRNSMPFLKKGWTVTAQDIVESALKGYSVKAGRLGGRLHTRRESLKKKLPYPNRYFQAALEITVADNLTSIKLQRQLWRELARVIRPGGYLLSYYFTLEDGFYGKLLMNQHPEKQPVVYDQHGGMQFRFYSAADIVTGSQGQFQLWQAKHYRYRAPMHGKTYSRDLVAAILKRTKN